MSQEMKDPIVLIVEEHPDFVLHEINTELRLRCPNAPHLSISSIANHLKNQLIVTKTLYDAPVERN